jgi:hypothetical protein
VLAIAALAAAVALWAIPQPQRASLLAEAGERVAPWRQAIEAKVAELDIRVPDFAALGDRGGEDGDGPRRGGDDNDVRLTARAKVPSDDGEQLAARGDDADRVSRIEIVDGVPTVRLETWTQARSGVEITVLQAVSFSPEISAFGRVVDLHSLLDLRGRHTVARHEADVIAAALSASKREYERLLALTKEEGLIATKRLQQAEADVSRDEARLRLARAEIRVIRDQCRQEWGPELTAWALDGKSEAFDDLLSRQEVLLLVTLPAGAALPEGTGAVLVARDGDRGNAREARYVAPAPYADPVIQGETYFFRTAAGRLRSDMRVDVWIEQPALSATGVIVPQSAVVWAAGQAWAYVRVDDEHFARRAIPTGVEGPGGWFVADAVRSGERLVVAGAQMLYAEEFRWQIRDEDKD